VTTPLLRVIDEIAAHLGQWIMAMRIRRGAAMRVPQENDGWNPIKSAPFDEDVTLQVTDGRGGPYSSPTRADLPRLAR
jgi:hypothetical protein